jgi:glycosyltransferase involved in cell wall biosynthesis
MNLSNKKILIFCDYFYPAYKGGGIIQSLKNLFDSFGADNQFQVIASNEDLGGEKLDLVSDYPGVNHIAKRKVLNALINVDWKAIEYVYFNGIYSPFFFLIPLIYLRIFQRNVKVVIAPRGMLQSGALEIRSGKKGLYLTVLKTFKLLKNVRWHATDEQELQDVKAQMGDESDIVIAPNIPKKPYQQFNDIEWNPTLPLKLVFLSLITEKKNLHLILESLKISDLEIQFDIYGPVKDLFYWETCKSIIKDLPVNVKYTYHGPVEPNETQSKFEKSHALILPSKGENFGHAIYECFSVGRPAIIGWNTPWGDLNKNECGFTTDLTVDSINTSIKKLQALTFAEYSAICENSLNMAQDYHASAADPNSYKALFA